jgi:hypothetical protein
MLALVIPPPNTYHTHMKKLLSAAALACVFATPALAQNNPFAGMKGKMKEGEWEYTMKMSMPGMPGGGMTMPGFRQCVTAAQIEKGGVGQKDGQMPDGCSVRNVKVAGNTASYTMECTKDPKMVSDVNMTFSGDTFSMKQNTTMDQGGQKMQMVNDMTGKYVGPCK